MTRRLLNFLSLGPGAGNRVAAVSRGVRRDSVFCFLKQPKCLLDLYYLIWVVWVTARAGANLKQPRLSAAMTSTALCAVGGFAVRTGRPVGELLQGHTPRTTSGTASTDGTCSQTRFMHRMTSTALDEHHFTSMRINGYCVNCGADNSVADWIGRELPSVRTA